MSKYYTLVLTIFALSSTACGNTYSSVRIEQETLPYVQQFEALYNLTVDVSIEFTDHYDQGPRIVGMCYGSSVSLLKSYWDSVGDTDRKLLVFHELGHCVFNRGHREDTAVLNSRQVPQSIMFPYTFDSAYYLQREEYYNEELSHYGK